MNITILSESVNGEKGNGSHEHKGEERILNVGGETYLHEDGGPLHFPMMIVPNAMPP